MQPWSVCQNWWNLQPPSEGLSGQFYFYIPQLYSGGRFFQIMGKYAVLQTGTTQSKIKMDVSRRDCEEWNCYYSVIVTFKSAKFLILNTTQCEHDNKIIKADSLT